MEKKDYLTLKRILNFHRYYEDYAHKDALEQLGDRIDNALVEDEWDMPDDVVRLNSKVTVEFMKGSRQSFQLAYFSAIQRLFCLLYSFHKIQITIIHINITFFCLGCEILGKAEKGLTYRQIDEECFHRIL